jgi:dynein regulatry complex protein 1
LRTITHNRPVQYPFFIHILTISSPSSSSIIQIIGSEIQIDALTENDQSAMAAARQLAETGGSSAILKVVEVMRELDLAKERTLEEITSVRIAADARELERRALETSRVADRQQKLREEAGMAARANASVTMRWADLRERALPQELANELEEQKTACLRILQARDVLLNGLTLELKQKDEEFIKGLSQQRLDIDALLTRMATQFSELRDAYADELAAVEAAFVKEREDMLVANKADIDSLFDARRRAEGKFADEKLQREDKNAAEIYAIQAADLENYQKLKVKLETDVAILEQQLEHMKFIYLLNTEKLEYNYRVLTERDNENKAALASQKARLGRLRASLAKVQVDYESSDHKFKVKNDGLTKEYQRATKSYRELQEKFRHFEAANAARYAAVAKVHEEEIHSLSSRLVTADRVITEQLLGLSWTPQPVPTASSTVSGLGAGRLATTASLRLPSAQSALDGENSGIGGSNLEAGTDANINSVVASIDQRKLEPLLRLLVSECGPFLGDEATRELCAKLDSERKHDQARVLRAEAVLKSIGCSSDVAIASLLNHFEVSIGEAGALSSASASSLTGGSATEEDVGVFSLILTRNDGLPILPPGFSVLKALRAWMEAQKAVAAAATEGSKDGANRDGSNNVNLEDTMKRLTDAQAREGGDTSSSSLTLIAKGYKGTDKQHDLGKWQRLADQAVPPSKVRVWKSLEKGMQKYQKVLLKRADLINECDSLEASNKELRQLLEFYLSQPQAAQLKVGPSQTITLGGQTQDVTQIAERANLIASQTLLQGSSTITRSQTKRG